MKTNTLVKRSLLALAITAFAAVSVGCTAQTGTSEDDASGATTDPAVVEAANQLVDELTAPVENPDLLPAFTPTSEAKRIGILDCGFEAVSCQRMTQGAVEGAEAIGWETVIADGKLTPAGWNAGMAYLIQEEVDLIIKFSEADNAIPAAMDDAAAAGIPVLCAVCANNSSEPIANPSLANADVDFTRQGEAIAAYAIAKSDGTARMYAHRVDGVPPLLDRVNALEEAIAECEGCDLIEVLEVVQEPGWDTKIRNENIARLNQIPAGELDYIVPPSDTNSRAIAEALVATGREDVEVLSYDCEDHGVDMIKEGGPEVVCASTPLTWLGWAAFDLAVRHLSDEPVEDVLVPFQLIDSSNVEEIDSYDYASAYRELWGK